MEVNVKNINNVISKVEPGKIADELDIEEGDLLISVNGKKINDIIEYRFLMADDYVELEIQKINGERVIYEIEKDFDEDLGIEFSNPIIDSAMSCRNKCIFCFIDQLPKGMRETLYFKDDDSRLSFLQGNFVTLTNMTEKDIQNIINYRISPINVSVHTTNPELRVKMINNKWAGEVFPMMKRLADAGITMNAQVVLCPGVNDGKEIIRTIDDLKSLYPNVNSIAVVPVGITKHRDHLPHLEIFDKEKSRKLIEQISKKQEELLNEIGTRFVFLADEFFVMAETEFPKYDEYEGFLQFEDGVGMIIKMKYEIVTRIEQLADEGYRGPDEPRTVSLATGHSAYGFISEMAELIEEKFDNIKVNVYKIRNEFWGETITVSGLITAGDIIKQIGDKNLGDNVFVTRSMMKADEEIFLDDITIDELSDILETEVVACQNEGQEFVDRILGIYVENSEVEEEDEFEVEFIDSFDTEGEIQVEYVDGEDFDDEYYEDFDMDGFDEDAFEADGFDDDVFEADGFDEDVSETEKSDSGSDKSDEI